VQNDERLLLHFPAGQDISPEQEQYVPAAQSRQLEPSSVQLKEEQEEEEQVRPSLQHSQIEQYWPSP
jgi:hypothetical protein